MDWKTELYDKVGNDDIQRSDVEAFMAAKFEELIEDIPVRIDIPHITRPMESISTEGIKQQLRSRWLGKD